MPIYEFYCSACNTLFNFFSSRVDTTAAPRCPRCDRPNLEKRPARFAMLKHGGEEPDPFDDLDDDRMAGVMESLMDEMGDLEDSADPRVLANLMRRFGESSGLELGPKMDEMVRRLEAGEDPDTLESEFGDAFDEDDSFDEFFRAKKIAAARSRRPRVDETLHFL